MKYPSASIKAIRQHLEKIDGCLIGEPITETYDLGRFPHVLLNDPERQSADTIASSPETSLIDELDSVSSGPPPPITLEFPPELDHREVEDFLSNKVGRDIKALLKIKNIDALGWYVPFHQLTGQYGIYISSLGVLQLAITGFRSRIIANPLEDLKFKIELSMDAIRRHEAMHFAVECMSVNWELLLDKACYVPASRRLKSNLGYIEREEGLANAYMLRGFRWPPAWRKRTSSFRDINQFVKTSPPGYRDGVYCVQTIPYLELIRDLTFEYLGASQHYVDVPDYLFSPLTMFDDAYNIDDRRCPLILVDEENVFSRLGISANFISTINIIEESASFKKELRKLGQKAESGWYKARTHLGISTTFNGLDFKPWPPRGKGWFSIKIEGGMRAHLRLDKAAGVWVAEEIGTHDKMGH